MEISSSIGFLKGGIDDILRVIFIVRNSGRSKDHTRRTCPFEDSDNEWCSGVVTPEQASARSLNNQRGLYEIHCSSVKVAHCHEFHSPFLGLCNDHPIRSEQTLLNRVSQRGQVLVCLEERCRGNGLSHSHQTNNHSIVQISRKTKQISVPECEPRKHERYLS